MKSISNIEKMLNSMYFPKSWIKESINLPINESRKLTLKVCIYLYNIYNLIPINIKPSIEGGIYVVYLNNNIKLELEIYNDLDIAGIVTRNKQFIICEEINDFNFSNLINVLINT